MPPAAAPFPPSPPVADAVDIPPPPAESTFITLPPENPAEQQRSAAADEQRAAALAAVPFSWAGRELRPFTPSREAAFHQHRSALNAPPFHECIGSAVTFMADAARLLYFLSHEPADWLQFLARQPRVKWISETEFEPVNAHAALEARIFEWMDQTFRGTLQERVEVYQLCLAILERARLTRARVETDSSPDDSGN